MKRCKQGSHILIESLQKQNVDLIFGYPGGAILPFYDALYDSGIKHILTRHEQAAIHAAEGYARSTGKAGIVVTSSGPGATNLVTGIADAYMDSTPLVILTGQVTTDSIGEDAFQEVDVLGMTMPVTKHSYQIRRAADIPRVIAEAFHIATTGRPGPVLIDLPKDTMGQSAEYEHPAEVYIPGYQPTIKPNILQINKLCQAIEKAKKPLLYIGGGVISADATAQLRAFIKKTSIPVVSTLMGLGAVPADDPLFVGMLGMHGSYAANQSVYHCDLLIACGVRFDDRATGKIEQFSPRSKKAHIDIDPAEIGKNIEIDIPIVADLKQALNSLLERTPSSVERHDWLEQIRSWDSEHRLTVEQDPSILKPQTVIQLLSEWTNGEAFVTTDVGQHQMWAAHFYHVKQPRKWITSGGLGTMGYGLPAAIGAKLANPDQTVICVSGDASIQMNIQEFQTIKDHNIDLKIFILNNGYLGLVRQQQELLYNQRIFQSKISSPDFSMVSKAYKLEGTNVRTPDEAETVIKQALDHHGPIVVNFFVHDVENVYPMVPPGSPNAKGIYR